MSDLLSRPQTRHNRLRELLRTAAPVYAVGAHDAKSHAALLPALLVTCGYDMLRDVAHAYARKLATDGNDITYVHYPDLPHAFIQTTMHFKTCLQAIEEVASLFDKALSVETGRIC